MTRNFDTWARPAARAFIRCNRIMKTVLGHRLYKSIFDVPGRDSISRYPDGSGAVWRINRWVEEGCKAKPKSR